MHYDEEGVIGPQAPFGLDQILKRVLRGVVVAQFSFFLGV